MPINKSQLWGLVAILVGCGLIMGGGMLLLVTLIEPKFTQLFLPAVVQIALGILGAVAGILFRRQYSLAKYIFAFVAVGVTANVVYALTIFARMATDEMGAKESINLPR